MTAPGVVVIGRNEGERLMRCLASLSGLADVIYVDSGSTDGSVERARALGVEVVELAVPPVFTAARARNAGIAALLRRRPDVTLVQTVDGDCEVEPGWIGTATTALAAESDLALVFGRRCERFPDRSIYNALCDDEWNVPVGEAAGCGGDALFRVAALQQVGGYNEAMIAGEDSELSMRLRQAGWRLRRIDAAMTRHDAAITRFTQWWRRQGRGGHGFAEMAHLHPDARWPDWPRTCRSIMFWGAAMPAALAASLVLAALRGPGWLVLPLVLAAPWPAKMLQIARAKRRAGLPPRVALAAGVLLMVGKIPELFGLLRFQRNRVAGRQSTLIEYKEASAS